MHLYNPVPSQESNYTEESQKSKKLSHSVLKWIKKKFSQFWPGLLLVAYSALGGLIFRKIEGENARQTHNSILDKSRKVGNQTARLIQDYIIASAAGKNETLVILSEEFLFSEESLFRIMQILQRYARKMGLQHEDFTEWTFLGSVFYSATVCTSIGYGNMAPKTLLGRSLTMFYAIFGIPLLLYTLSRIGKRFCHVTWHLYLFATRICTGRKLTGAELQDVGRFPFSLAILLTVAWILLCAALFTIFEDWDFFTSFYFFFQSLTTIGFGDVTPQEPRRMLVGFILIIVGMSLVSMCWNLMQIKVAYFVAKLVSQIKEKYVQTEFQGLTLTADRENIMSEIENMSSNESLWLSRLMGSQHQSDLVDEWLRRAGMRNQAIQVKPTTQNTQTQHMLGLMVNASIQSNESFVLSQSMSKFPEREILRSWHSSDESNDECRNLFKQISDILEDCHKIVAKRPVET